MAEDPATPNHAQRVAVAARILTSLDQWVDRLALPAALAPTSSNVATNDANLKARLVAVLPAYLEAVASGVG